MSPYHPLSVEDTRLAFEPDEATIAPRQDENRIDRVGQRTSSDRARDIFNAHKRGLEARRQRDLISEKLLLHIDGSGDFQWADILQGTRVEIPRLISEFRKTENLLRPIVDNAVAYHTTMPLRFHAEAPPDRESRDQAIVDTVWANFLAQTQDFNGLFAEAMYLAMPAGFCPVHGYWREDVAEDWYETIEYGEGYEGYDPMATEGPAPGMIDCWVGNPFDTVFNRGAKRGSVRWCSYGRVLNADLVRQAFSHVPEARTLEGSSKVPSAAEFQRIARDWRMAGLGVHGDPIQTYRRDDGEELLSVICRETAPGVLPDWPEGRLEIIAVEGDVDMRRGEGRAGNATLLADQKLPARDFSWTLFYSHHRGSDIHGKPWVEDLDQLQVDLNIALSKRWEVINKMAEAPIVSPGGAIADDMADIGGYNLLEVEPSLAGWKPRVMEWPQSIVQALDNEITERRQAMYTLGGYQASSRGEAPGSRTPYRAIVALQQADNTIHGPVNMRFRRSACDFMRRCWSQMKTYGSVPWLIDVMGDEHAHLVEPYVDNTRLSKRPPQFKLVNAFGPSPELRAQEIVQLMQTRGADGEPFLKTAEARRQYPNQLIFDDGGDPDAVRRRRARTIAKAFVEAAKDLRQRTGIQHTDMAHPAVRQAAHEVFQTIEERFPRMRDDMLQAHLSALSEITQDETADPIARIAAQYRQNLYYQWQQQMAQTAVAPQTGGGAGGGGGPEGAMGNDTMNRREIISEFESGGADGEGSSAPGVASRQDTAIAATAR